MNVGEWIPAENGLYPAEPVGKTSPSQHSPCRPTHNRRGGNGTSQGSESTTSDGDVGRKWGKGGVSFLGDEEEGLG